VLTYNTKHRDVPIQLAAVSKEFKTTFSQQQPDFILLQEVVFDRPSRMGHDNTASAFAELIGYEARGQARDGGAEGVSILSRHPFLYFDHLHIQARDALLSGGFPRVSIMGEFDCAGIGRVRVVNVHLTQRRSQSDIRRQQLQETLEWMNRRQAEAPADVIILGGNTSRPSKLAPRIYTFQTFSAVSSPRI
jgi:endonuclease/exonuclease/phosphatase family metal-dependent hydrolase